MPSSIENLPENDLEISQIIENEVEEFNSNILNIHPNFNPLYESSIHTESIDLTYESDNIDQNKLLQISEDDLTYESDDIDPNNFLQFSEDELENSIHDSLSCDSDSNDSTILEDFNYDYDCNFENCCESQDNTDDSENNFEKNFFENTEKLFEHLDITRNEVIFMIMSYYLRYNLTWTALESLLTLINSIFGKKVIPDSKYLFKQLFRTQTPQYHFFCSECNFYFDFQLSTKSISYTCEICGYVNNFSTKNNKNFFVTLPVESQVKNILKKNVISVRAEEQSSRSMSDIHDGILYKKLLETNNNRLITLTLNTDGVNIFKSSNKSSFWPLQMVINELDPSIRFKTENILVTGFWFGSTPNLDIFLKPFINEVNEINSRFIKIETLNEEFEAYLIPLIITLDTVAKDLAHGKIKFNGKFGCSYCLHPGTTINGCIKYTNISNIAKRNHNDSIANMKEAQLTGKLVNGFKKITTLAAFPFFNVVHGFAIDDMHGSYLGVCRQMCELWFDSSNHNRPFYMGLRIKLIDKHLLQISQPQRITRKREISCRKNWKAQEFKNWLLYFGLPCMYKQLPLRYIKHFALLSNSMYVLLQDEISDEEFKSATDNLQKFVLEFENLYGSKCMNFNVHLMSHISDCVENCGPLWAYSNFPFESNNGYLKKFINGTTDVLQQMVSKYTFNKLSENTNNIPKNVVEFISKIKLNRHVKKIDKVNDNLVFLGTPKRYSRDENCSLMNELNLMLEESYIMSYQKVILNGSLYCTVEYSEKIKSNDSIIILCDGSFGKIHKIIRYYHECSFIVNLCFKKMFGDVASDLCSQLIFVEKIDTHLVVVKSCNILKKGILIETNNCIFISSFPNKIECE